MPDKRSHGQRPVVTRRKGGEREAEGDRKWAVNQLQPHTRHATSPCRVVDEAKFEQEEETCLALKDSSNNSSSRAGGVAVGCGKGKGGTFELTKTS